VGFTPRAANTMDSTCAIGPARNFSIKSDALAEVLATCAAPRTECSASTKSAISFTTILTDRCSNGSLMSMATSGIIFIVLSRDRFVTVVSTRSFSRLTNATSAGDCVQLDFKEQLVAADLRLRYEDGQQRAMFRTPVREQW